MWTSLTIGCFYEYTCRIIHYNVSYSSNARNVRHSLHPIELPSYRIDLKIRNYWYSNLHIRCYFDAVRHRSLKSRLRKSEYLSGCFNSSNFSLHNSNIHFLQQTSSLRISLPLFCLNNGNLLHSHPNPALFSLLLQHDSFLPPFLRFPRLVLFLKEFPLHFLHNGLPKRYSRALCDVCCFISAQSCARG